MTDDDIIICSNRKAYFNYEIIEKFIAGISLKGSEVKSLRNGNASLQDSYVIFMKGAPHILNFYIAPYPPTTEELDPRRTRQLLLTKAEINHLIGKSKMRGLTIIPLKVLFRKGKWAKVEIALAKGKKLYDKRETIKRREAEREERKLEKYK